MAVRSARSFSMDYPVSAGTPRELSMAWESAYLSFAKQAVRSLDLRWIEVGTKL